MGFSTDNLKDCTDAQLCEMVKNKDEIAFSELVCRYSGLIDIKSSLFFNDYLDKDDFFQEGTLTLLNAAKSYLPGSGTSFKTYAAVCIERRFISLVKFQTRKKHVPKNNIFSISSVGEFSDAVDLSENSDPVNVVIEKEMLSSKKEYIKDILSPFEYKVLSLHIMGYKYKRIAEVLNISPKSVDNALQRIKNKLKNN